MSHDTCGLHPHQRNKKLYDCGFKPTDDGKGSHTKWVHPELTDLINALKNEIPDFKIEVPANRRSNVAQGIGTISVPGDPARHTWESVLKYAEWCQDECPKLKKTLQDARSNAAVQPSLKAGKARPNSPIHRP